jgi:hypothetical protein
MPPVQYERIGPVPGAVPTLMADPLKEYRERPDFQVILENSYNN